MSTPDNRSVNFLAYFAGAALREDVADGKAAGARFRRKPRHSYDALCHTIYAACRRLYIMLADSAGRSVRSGRGDRPVRPELAYAGIMVVRKRSVTPLPPSILNWFYEVRGKLQEAGQALAPVEGKPDYQALADTLKRAFKQLDKTFLDDL